MTADPAAVFRRIPGTPGRVRERVVEGETCLNVDCGVANVKPHAGKWHYMYSFDNPESAFESFRAERTDVPVAKATRHVEKHRLLLRAVPCICQSGVGHRA